MVMGWARSKRASCISPCELNTANTAEKETHLSDFLAAQTVEEVPLRLVNFRLAAHHQVASLGGQAHVDNSAVGRVDGARDEMLGIQVLDEFTHRLGRHVRAPRQIGRGDRLVVNDQVHHHVLAGGDAIRLQAFVQAPTHQLLDLLNIEKGACGNGHGQCK